MFDCQFLVESIRARFRISGAKDLLLISHRSQTTIKIAISHFAAFILQ
jgi:hypothetical protein